MSQRMVYRAIWIPSLIVLVVLLLLPASKPAALSAPGPLTSFVTEDKTISVLYPANWEKAQASSHSVSTGVVFKSGDSVRIDIDTDLQGSLMADISKSPMGSGIVAGIPGAENMGASQKTPLEKLHDLQGKKLSDKYASYEEGEATKQQIAGTEALLTDFTFKDGATAMTGKRVTALVGDRRLSITCYCPKEAEAKIAPVFDQMIASLKVGENLQ